METSENREQKREIHPKSLANLKPFQPGQSGNPGGRPKKRLIDEALEELLEANDSSEAREIAKKLIERAKAGDGIIAKLVSERTQGKPSQKVEVTGADGGPVQSRVIVEFVSS